MLQITISQSWLEGSGANVKRAILTSRSVVILLRLYQAMTIQITEYIHHIYLINDNQYMNNVY